MYTELSLPEWHLTSELKWYEPTKRILKMSKPKFYEKYDAEKRQRELLDKALTYKGKKLMYCIWDTISTILV